MESHRVNSIISRIISPLHFIMNNTKPHFYLDFSIECYCTVVWNLVQKYCIVTSLLLFWCPYMVINVSVHNGGLLSPRYYTVGLM